MTVEQTNTQTQEQQTNTQTGAFDFSGFDEIDRGYLKNRGLEGKPANEIIKNLADAHREAQRAIGGDEKSIIRLPKDANDPAWASIRQRLGAAPDAAGYKFEGIKRADGTDVDAKFLDVMRAAAHASGVSVQQASDIARAIVKHNDDAAAEAAAIKQDKLAQESAKLKENWGANYNVNKLAADNAARALGVTEEQVKTLAEGLGGAAVMELFRQISLRIGEDSFEKPGGGAPKIMTKDQAIARKAELMKDVEWKKRLDSGDIRAKNELDDLLRVIVS